MKKTLLLVGLAALAVPAAHGEGAFTIYSENDKYFAGTDRHYTNGFKLTYADELEHPRLNALGSLLDQLGRHLAVLEPARSPDQPPPELKLTFSLGQNIYTPTLIHTSTPDPHDRPYAAWLYGAVGFQRQEARQLQVIELDFGMVGPAALGREIQNGWHNVIHVAHAEGWSHQLHNEPGLDLTYDWRHRWLATTEPATGLGFDVIPRWGVSLGNVQTYLSAGPLVRAGWRLPADYGPDLIRAAGGSDAKTRGLSVFLFGSANGRAVARDIFLDGNTFEDSPSVRKRPLVADLSAGLAIYWGVVHFAYTQNYRTLEFYGQKQRDVFGSLSMSFVW
ncbi:MAG TPA: lipid A deacylase LpxR family protein [Opitutaceae bacterium]|jgi:lipid A 3-O-deacylase|nr:lipid A deacylase LpxR family protein [Opitutaceae bacterium]